MATYQHPGVYLEEIPSGVRPIEGVATSVAAFVGAAPRGKVGEPVLIQGLDDYEREFGPLRGGTVADANDAMGLALSLFYSNGGKTAYVLRLVDKRPETPRAPASTDLVTEAAVAVLKLKASSEGDWGDKIRYRLTKKDTSPLIFDLAIGYEETGPDGLPKLKVVESYVGLSMNPRELTYAPATINRVSRFVELELLENVAKTLVINGKLTGKTLPTAPDYLKTALDELKGELVLGINLDGLGTKVLTLKPTLVGTAADGGTIAKAIQAAIVALAPQQDPWKSFTCTFANGHFDMTSPKSASSSVVVSAGLGAEKLGIDPKSATLQRGWAPLVPKAAPARPLEFTNLTSPGAAGPPVKQDYANGFKRLEKVRDINMIVLPGQNAAPGTSNDAIAEAVAHCEATGSRMLIVDPPKGLEIDTAEEVDSLGLTTSTYAVCYYPWVRVTNPRYDADDATSKPTIVAAPSAVAAGLWARTDSRRGVWKAPAGVEAALNGVVGLEHDVGDGAQDQLNPAGINAIRKMPGFGLVVWGARTLATRASPEWRYVPVRRTALMIEQSIYNGIQWAVFEPNDHRLWSSLRVNIGSFMDGLFRSGAFQGEKASDAYFVRCGLGDTMTQGDIDRGQVIVVVGFAPLKPTEFVIVRIQQKVQQ